MHPDVKFFLKKFVEIRQSYLEEGMNVLYIQTTYRLFDRAKNHGILPEESYAGGENSELLDVVVEPRFPEQLEGEEFKVVEYNCAECCQELLNCKKGKYCPICGTKDF